MRNAWGVFISLMLGAGVAVAGDIKAIVNDVPISAFDVEARAKMLMLQQAGHVGRLTPDLRKTALDELVDEKIKRQEMLKQGIEVRDEDVQEALAHLEAQNGLPAGGFRTVMREEGVPYQTLIDQTVANLGWIRLMQKSGRITTVTDADIAARQKMIRKDLSRAAVSFAEIVVPTEKKALAVWQQLQDGTDFVNLVEKESVADSRLTGGRVMDVTPDVYGKEAATVLNAMQVGQLSRPLKVKDGYAIILMLNKRAPVEGDKIVVWELAQAVVPKGSRADEQLKGPVKNSCDGFANVVKEDALQGSLQRGQVSPDQLPAEVAPLLKTAPFQKVLGPVQTPVGQLYFMKCGYSEIRVMPTEAALRAQIEGEKMELMARQLLSELKRDAVVEYK